MYLHREEHITHSQSIRDWVIGMADGLTVPFALAAGLSSAVNSNEIIVAAGCGEIAAGAIAMGLGGYLATKTQLQHYKSEYAREWQEIKDVPEVEAKEVSDILEDFGIAKTHIEPIIEGFKANPQKWVDFMMRFELNLEKPDAHQIWLSPIVIGLAYIIGGLIPLSPYMLMKEVQPALLISIAITGVALLLFGTLKAQFTGLGKWRTALETLIIGGLAAMAAYFIASLIT